MRGLILLPLLLSAATTLASSQHLAPPPEGKLYHGFFYDGPAVDEHDVRAEDVARYEQAVGADTAWVFFSDNWFESRAFPVSTCRWIQQLGKVPYVRLMLRSDLDQNHGEKLFSLANILTGNFDQDLRAWARSAAAFGSPIMIEWGTEPNGKWFAWNGKWNGGPGAGPERYVATWRHIVDLMRAEGATNLLWVWHVNWDDDPEAKWNQMENYYPGGDYCDWLAVSIYGALTPQTEEGIESFRYKMRKVYPRLTALALGKPILLAEFGSDIHHPTLSASEWAKAALEGIFDRQWPAVIGFCWWNEGWENDDHRKHNTDMNILHDSELTEVFRRELAEHRGALQESPLFDTTLPHPN